ncbi:MAG: hypothetical protein AB7F43_11360 [Bacteriovoracia bacterium]
MNFLRFAVVCVLIFVSSRSFAKEPNVPSEISTAFTEHLVQLNNSGWQLIDGTQFRQVSADTLFEAASKTKSIRLTNSLIEKNFLLTIYTVASENSGGYNVSIEVENGKQKISRTVALSLMSKEDLVAGISKLKLEFDSIGKQLLNSDRSDLLSQILNLVIPSAQAGKHTAGKMLIQAGHLLGFIALVPTVFTMGLIWFELSKTRGGLICAGLLVSGIIFSYGVGGLLLDDSKDNN